MKPYGTHRSGIGWNPHGIYCGECSEKNCFGCRYAKMQKFEISGTIIHKDDTYEPVTKFSIEAETEAKATHTIEQLFHGILRDVHIKKLSQ